MLSARTAATLVELLVTLFIAGVVLGLVASTGVRQQRLYGEVGRRLMAREQLRHAAAILPIDLRAASAVEGDIVSGEARDTSLEIQATLGSSVTCEPAGTAVVILAASADANLGAFADSPREGDSVRVLDEAADVERWRALPVRSAWASARPCRTSRAGPDPSPARAVPTIVVETGRAEAGDVAAGLPVRLTRRVRYSIYQAADGRWYIGYCDWNAAQGRYNVIQPVSGPFLPHASGVEFRYYDGGGTRVPSGAAATAAITRIEVVLRAATAPTLGEAGPRASADSALVTVAVRNPR